MYLKSLYRFVLFVAVILAGQQASLSQCPSVRNLGYGLTFSQTCVIEGGVMKIEGVVQDSLRKEPIAFIPLRVLTDTLVTGTTSDLEGRYELVFDTSGLEMSDLFIEYSGICFVNEPEIGKDHVESISCRIKPLPDTSTHLLNYSSGARYSANHLNYSPYRQ